MKNLIYSFRFIYLNFGLLVAFKIILIPYFLRNINLKHIAIIDYLKKTIFRYYQQLQTNRTIR